MLNYGIAVLFFAIIAVGGFVNLIMITVAAWRSSKLVDPEWVTDRTTMASVKVTREYDRVMGRRQ